MDWYFFILNNFQNDREFFFMPIKNLINSFQKDLSLFSFVVKVKASILDYGSKKFEVGNEHIERVPHDNHQLVHLKNIQVGSHQGMVRLHEPDWIIPSQRSLEVIEVGSIRSHLIPCDESSDLLAQVASEGGPTPRNWH